MRPEHWLLTIPIAAAEYVTQEGAHRRARLDLGGIEQTKKNAATHAT